MAIAAIQHLADLIHSRWSATSFDDGAFPPLAAEALRETALHSSISAADIVESLISPWHSSDHLSHHVCPQIVTLFSSTHFDVRGHFWVDEIGSPHQHGWSGAYQVIEGSSLEALFEFSQLARVRTSFRLGELRTRSIRMLNPGDTVAVEAGKRMLHALWHIDRPAVSVSVRARLQSDRTMDYLRPGVAFDTLPRDIDWEMRGRCLDFLARTDTRAYQIQLERLARHADLPTTFFALRQAFLEYDPVGEAVLDAARSRHGDLFRIVERSLADISRYRSFNHLRPQVRERGSRQFLGLLYLAPDRDAIHRFVAGQCPNQPVFDTLGARLSRLLIRQEAAHDDGVPPPLCRAFGHIACGDGLRRGLAALEETASADELPALTELVEKAHAEMQRSLVFRPLFV